MKTHKRRMMDRTFCGLTTLLSDRVYRGTVLKSQLRHFWKDVTCRKCHALKPKPVVHKLRDDSDGAGYTTVCKLDRCINLIETSWEGWKDVTCKSCKLLRKKRG